MYLCQVDLLGVEISQVGDVKWLISSRLKCELGSFSIRCANFNFFGDKLELIGIKWVIFSFGCVNICMAVVYVECANWHTFGRFVRSWRITPYCSAL